ncbi:MAG: hypothetical protein ABFS42_06770 [Candidatus Krumholzibacteriota bacterium]
MKTPMPLLLAILLTALLAVGANAQDFGPGNGDGNGVCRFIDEDGDGFNDLAPDADGDGIPNGLDPDYVKPEDGTGLMNRWARKYGELFRKYFGEDAVGAMNGMGGNHYGPGDGTGTGTGPGDGTGFGPGTGTGDCPGEGDGSGSPTQTQERRGGRR